MNIAYLQKLKTESSMTIEQIAEASGVPACRSRGSSPAPPTIPASTMWPMLSVRCMDRSTKWKNCARRKGTHRRRIQDAGLRRSMSKKGCSPDSSACEGFFGHIKNEMFYNRSWQGIGTKQFIPILNDYLIWYREKRIKLSLHGLSPIEYRRKSGLI